MAAPIGLGTKAHMQGAQRACAAWYKQNKELPGVNAHLLFVSARVQARQGNWEEACAVLSGLQNACFGMLEPELGASILHLRSSCLTKLGQLHLAREYLFESAMVR